MKVLAVPLVLLAAGAPAALASGPHKSPYSGECSATAVRYVPSKHPRLGNLPWVLGRPGNAGLVGYLVDYGGGALADGRVNQSDGLVIYTGGRTPGGGTTKILWMVWQARRSAPTLLLTGRRLDAPGSFSQRVRSSGRGRFPSIVDVPEPGCWRLTLQAGNTRATVVLRAVEPQPGPRCDATPVGSHELGILLRPRSAGVIAGWGGWETPEGGALIFTRGGPGPRGENMKVLWRARPRSGDLLGSLTGSLTLLGRRLDGASSFRQQFSKAAGGGDFAIYPKIVRVPEPGCWLLTARTGATAGILVVRAVDPG